jgi:hypothetical protein
VEGNGCDLFQYIIPKLFWTNWGKPQKSSFRILRVPTEIRNSYILNTSRKLYHLSQLVIVIPCSVVEITDVSEKNLLPPSYTLNIDKSRSHETSGNNFQTLHTALRNALEKSKVWFLLQEMLLAPGHCCGRLQNNHCGQPTSVPVKNWTLFRVLLNELKTLKARGQAEILYCLIHYLSMWTSPINRNIICLGVYRPIFYAFRMKSLIFPSVVWTRYQQLSGPVQQRLTLRARPKPRRLIPDRWFLACNSIKCALSYVGVAWPNWLRLPCVCAIRRPTTPLTEELQREAVSLAREHCSTTRIFERETESNEGLQM